MTQILIGSLLAVTAAAAGHTHTVPSYAAESATGANAEVRLFPLVRSGVTKTHEYTTNFLVYNSTDQPATLEIEFFCEHGKAWELPFNKNRLSRISEEIGPRRGLSYNTASKEKLELAWARVRSSPPGAISVEAVGWVGPTGGKLRSYSMQPVPGDLRQTTLLFLADDSLVLVNDSGAEQTVQLVGRDESGKEMCRVEKTLGKGIMLANDVKTILGCTGDKPGTLEISAPGGVAAIGLRYPEDGSTMTVYAKGGIYQGSGAGSPRTPTLDDRLKEIFEIVLKPGRGPQ
jgi:hypothetical protein